MHSSISLVPLRSLAPATMNRRGQSGQQHRGRMALNCFARFAFTPLSFLPFFYRSPCLSLFFPVCRVYSNFLPYVQSCSGIRPPLHARSPAADKLCFKPQKTAFFVVSLYNPCVITLNFFPRQFRRNGEIVPLDGRRDVSPIIVIDFVLFFLNEIKFANLEVCFKLKRRKTRIMCFEFSYSRV